MKKLVLFFFSLIAVGLMNQSCDHHKTYAEMLEEEQQAIDRLIRDSNITVISQSEFYKKDSVTDVSKNEYVRLASGVYMQIVDKGSPYLEDTIRNTETVLVRFSEQSIMDSMKISVTNLITVSLVDEFLYTVTSSSIAGTFISGAMYSNYQSTVVPAGWLVPFPYIRDRAHVKLIVPSKMGHTSATRYVEPYFYDIVKFQFDR